MKRESLSISNSSIYFHHRTCQRSYSRVSTFLVSHTAVWKIQWWWVLYVQWFISTTPPHTSLFQLYSIFWTMAHWLPYGFFHRSDILWLYVSIYPWSDIHTRNYPKVSLFLLKLLIEGFHLLLSSHQPLIEQNYWNISVEYTGKKTVNFGALQAKLQLKVEQRSYKRSIF